MITYSLLLLALIADRPANEVVLFNGKNLEGWVAEGVSQYVKDGKPHPVWSVRDGKLVCTGKGFGFLRYDLRPFSDFDFHVEFRMAPGCNSGLGIRTRPFDPARSRATRPSFYSYEIQLFDDSGTPPSPHSSGSLYRYVAPAKNAIRPAGEWNSVDIECAGPLIKVTMNGETIIDFNQQTAQTLRQKPLAGYLCLQNHGGKIEFRALRVRELAPSVSRRP
ncbi:MAG: 3-keto-disaccharide hydrolase [Isosphaeraceae bacterium]